MLLIILATESAYESQRYTTLCAIAEEQNIVVNIVVDKERCMTLSKGHVHPSAGCIGIINGVVVSSGTELAIHLYENGLVLI